MAKLTTLKTGLQTAAPRLQQATPGQTREQQRATAEPWRNWYKLKRWLDLRMRVFARDLFTCQECKRMVGDTSLLVAHHTLPHKGNPVMFWDEPRIVCVCKACHDGPIKDRERKDQRYY